jgi:hypothetical protein
MFSVNVSSGLLNQMRLIILASAVGIVMYSLGIAIVFKLRGNTNFLNNLYLPGYKLKEKIVLTIISTVTFFIFGVATLIASQAIFQFNIKIYVQLSAFFTFALLAGYLSFITPMGIGVREGIITLGLSKITSAATAGFLSIFSRIVLIISELIFLLIIIVLQAKIKNK